MIVLVSVSIIIPVFRVEKYIERCIRSVMNQIYHDVDMECILVDDCSPDNSIQIAKRIINQYEGQIRFMIIAHEANKGLSVARNTGMSNASGDYFLFIDSDDYITDDCIEKLISVVLKYPDVEVVKGNHFGKSNFNESKIPVGPVDNDMLLRLLYMFDIPVMVWNTLIKRSLLEELGLKFMPELVYEDNLWTVQLFQHVNKMVFVTNKTYYYECNNEVSITRGVMTGYRPESLKHLIVLIDEELRIFDYKHFVLYTIYLSQLLIQMVDVVLKYRYVEAEYVLGVCQLRNRLMRHTLRHYRFILASFELLLYFPFQYLIRYSWFRHHFDGLARLTCKVAMAFDYLHNKNKL